MSKFTVGNKVWFTDLERGGEFAGVVTEVVGVNYVEVVKAVDAKNEDAEIFIFSGKNLCYLAKQSGQIMDGKFAGSI